MTATATRETGSLDGFVREGDLETVKQKLARLREPFPAEKVGKLPKRQKQADGSFAEIQLDYIGHADVTERLLDVDPEWNWEPMGVAPDGLPMMILNDAGHPVGLWIRLTVCGVTRIGYGSVAGGAFDAEKQLIGDALRNAAMRFGVALDLWRKELPPAETHDTANERGQTVPPGQRGGVTSPPKVKVLKRTALDRFCPEDGGALELVSWDNGHAAVCCANWREKDGGCKYRAVAEAALPAVEGFHDSTEIPW